MRRGHAGATIAILIATALLPSSASATFHEVSIREIFPGDSAGAEAEYVELQAYSSGQEFVQGHIVRFYGPAGSETGSKGFVSDVSNGQNNMTLLMATPAAAARFGVTPDETMPANLVNPGGGAVCWEALDCVSWGNFSKPEVLPSTAGSPAAPGGIPDGQAIRRTIAPGCPTLLEEGDDRDNSAIDFATVFPEPRPNSVPPTERTCGGGGGGGGGGGSGGQKGGAGPGTILKGRPAKRTSDRTPTFRFRSDEEGATFQCKLDGKSYRKCRSPFTTPRLALGPHTFRVRARHRGDVDVSPATYRFKVVMRKG
jgi:hypothetical protein